MAYETVTYFPENDTSDYKLLMSRICENSRSKIFTEARLEWRCANEDEDGNEIYGLEVEDAQCICRKSIKYTYYIDNKNTKKSLILGSCCIKKFLPEAVTCKECGNALKDIVERLKTNNLICPVCTRYNAKVEKERERMYADKPFYWRGHKYNSRLFKDIVHDEEFISDLYIYGTPFNSRSLDNILEYAKNYYNFM